MVYHLVNHDSLHALTCRNNGTLTRLQRLRYDGWAMSDETTQQLDQNACGPSSMEGDAASQPRLPSASECLPQNRDVESSTPVVVHANGASTPVLITRLRPGLTLGQLARLTGINKSTLSRLFNKRRRLNIDYATKIARALNCSIDRVVKTVNFQ